MTREQLAREIVALRKSARRPVVDVAKAIGVAQSTLTRWENARFSIPAASLRALAEHFGVEASTRERWLTAAHEEQPAESRVYLRRPDDAATRQRVFGERELRATRITTLGATLVPGLLQTERYMRAVVTAGGKLTGDRLEEWVVQRLWRQRILTESGREFVQLITPGALLWCATGPEVMVEQIERLAMASRLPSMRLGLVPIATPATVFPLHNMDLYADHDGRRSAVIGTVTGSAVVAEPEQDDDVARVASVLERVEQMAVFGNDARAELDRVADLYRDR